MQFSLASSCVVASNKPDDPVWLARQTVGYQRTNIHPPSYPQTISTLELQGCLDFYGRQGIFLRKSLSHEEKCMYVDVKITTPAATTTMVSAAVACHSIYAYPLSKVFKNLRSVKTLANNKTIG